MRVNIIQKEVFFMALFHCPECGKEISDKASACVHCGAPVIHDDPNSKRYSIFWKPASDRTIEEITEFLIKECRFLTSDAKDAATHSPILIGKNLTYEQMNAMKAKFASRENEIYTTSDSISQTKQPAGITDQFGSKLQSFATFILIVGIIGGVLLIATGFIAVNNYDPAVQYFIGGILTLISAFLSYIVLGGMGEILFLLQIIARNTLKKD